MRIRQASGAAFQALGLDAGPRYARWDLEVRMRDIGSANNVFRGFKETRK